MLRSVLARGASLARTVSKCQTLKPVSVVATQKATVTSRFTQDSGDTATDFMTALNNDIDGSDLRSIVQYMLLLDYVPEAPVLDAIMRACRRVDDYALTTRVLESVKYKLMGADDLYKDLISKVQPTLDELGILTPDQMGYDKPEFFTEDVFDIH